MKSIRILSFVLLICFCRAEASAQTAETYFVHVVEKGQTLYSIANIYETNQKDIINLNPGSDAKIQIGQKIKIPQQKKTENIISHTVRPGETLYRLTVIYKVTAKAIIEANPGLTAENLQPGKVIRIPGEQTPETDATQIKTPEVTISQKEEAQSVSSIAQSPCKTMHKIKKKETIFSISKAYNITTEELIAVNPGLRTQKLKKGKFLCIPYPTLYKQTLSEIEDTAKDATKNENISSESAKSKSLFVKKEKQRFSLIKAAIILPFREEESRSRMVEYYEGFLMAADSLKRSGVSFDLYVYDSGGQNASISRILEKKELKDMDIIFGPLHQQHIKPLAEFARDNNIRLVVPFSSKGSEVFENPYIYQINTPHSYLHSEIYKHFIRQFQGANVIILESEEPRASSKRTEFIKGLKQELHGNKSFTVKTASANASAEHLKSILAPNRSNIFVPTSDSNTALIKLIPSLTAVLGVSEKDGKIIENSKPDIQLFGYPEWQTYVKEYLGNYFELGTYFFSSFYANNLMPEVVEFTKNYRKWYSKDMANTHPKYGMMGFDTGFYFLKGLWEYGSDWEDNLLNLDFNPLQIGFKFQRVNSLGGFINKKVFFVHFTNNYEIRKINFD